MKEHPPRFTIKVLLLFLALTLTLRAVSMLFRIDLDGYLALHPSNLKEPWQWYRFLTYPFAGNGLYSWLKQALVLLAAGYILEERTTKKNLLGIALLSTLVGGILFSTLNMADELDRPIAQPGLVVWGFWVAAIVCGFLNWKLMDTLGRIIAAVFLLFIFGLWHEDTGYLVAQTGVVLSVLVYVVLFRVFNAPKYNSEGIALGGEVI